MWVQQEFVWKKWGVFHDIIETSYEIQGQSPWTVSRSLKDGCPKVVPRNSHPTPIVDQNYRSIQT